MSLIEFLDRGEPQLENITQRTELATVLRDLAELKPKYLAL